MGEFNSSWSGGSARNKSNFHSFLERLEKAGFSKEFINSFKIVLWDIPNAYYGNARVQFEDFADAPNFFYISGLDGSAVAFLMEGKEMKVTPRNAKELFAAAMDQDLLNRLEIVK